MPRFAPTPDDSPLLFQSFVRPALPSQERIPHLGHIGLLFLLCLAGLGCAALIAHAAVAAHLFGVSSLDQAATEFHYTLGTEAIFYFLTLGGSLIVFPLLWHKSFFNGLQWRGKAALARSGYLFSAALVCFLLAMLDGLVMPGPSDTPIDKLFRVPGAAWLLFAFGVTLAPFFEELGFRGFLLPALCTAFDWIAEKVTDQPPHFLDADGHPRWSMPAMIVAALLTSMLFALMHAEQTSYSVGPLLLLVCVSLVLCAARLLTRSLAASVLVHATYNFLLFTFMFLGSGGFKHLENM
ncbi:MAG: CPBP family intramembrane glutamic endopeptidase [Terracidiphilus sp.]